MGFLHKQHLANKKIEEEKQKQQQEETKVFIKEYRDLSRRHHRDFQPVFNFINGGRDGVRPGIIVIDTTERIKAEEEAKRKREENGK